MKNRRSLALFVVAGRAIGPEPREPGTFHPTENSTPPQNPACACAVTSLRRASFRRFSDALPLQRLLSSSDVFRQSEAKMKPVIKSPPIMSGIICPDAIPSGQNRRSRESAEGKDTKHVRRAHSEISDFYCERALHAAARKYVRERTDLSPY
jgi:hypothetical protein